MEPQYRLLKTVKAVKRNEIDLQAVRKILKSIKRTDTIYLACLDLLLQEEQKCAGHKKAYLEAKVQEDDKFAKIDRLEQIGNITLAKLAVDNMYDMSDPALLTSFRNKHQKAFEEEQRKVKQMMRAVREWMSCYEMDQ
jgi:hypothetical protein